MVGRGVSTRHERTGDVAPKRAGAKEKTPCRSNLFKIERGQNAPPHELQVQIHGLVGEPVTKQQRMNDALGSVRPTKKEPCRVHHGCQVGHTCTELVGRWMAFPAERSGFGGGVMTAWVRHDAKTGLPRPSWGREVAIAPAEHAEGGGVGWAEGVEVGEEVAEWPPWVLGRGRGVQEADDDLLRHGWVCESTDVGGERTDCESLFAKSASAWSIACTSAASPVSLTTKYGFVSAWSVLKIDVSYAGS